MENHTIITNNSRKAYIFHYTIFLLLLIVSTYYLYLGKIPSSFLITIIIAVFAGMSATEIHRISQTYEVNPNSIIHTKGYITRNSKRINLLAINDITISKTLYQRIFRLGNINVMVANAAQQTILRNLHNPHSFAETIEKNINKLHSISHQKPI